MTLKIPTKEIIFPCIKPDWPAPANVQAFTTVRSDGFSHAPYDSFNLGSRGDDPLAISANRAKLKAALELPADPVWLQQTHSNQAVCAHEVKAKVQADAAYTDKAHIVCAVLTADCVPLLITDDQGRKVAAVHAGWRGLAAGIIEATVKKLQLPNEELLVWIGPYINAEHYEVGADVYDVFVQQHSEAQEAFTALANQKWLADLSLLARQRLKQLGITHIYGGKHCTYSEETLFFSHRRDKGKTGNMASLIWKTESSI